MSTTKRAKPAITRAGGDIRDESPAGKEQAAGAMDPRDFEKKTQNELDDILNNALDELEDDEDFATAGTEDRKQGAGDGEGIKAMEDEDDDKAAKALQTLLEDFSNPQIAESLEKAFRHLGGHVEGDELLQESLKAAKAAEGHHETEDRREAKTAQEGDSQEPRRRSTSHNRQTGDPTPGSGPTPSTTAGAEYGFGDDSTDMDRTISRTLEMLSKRGAELEGQEAAAMEGAGEDMMRQMMGEFEKMGEKEDYNGVMDNIMQQLLSRELMYDPIKQICDKYPEWLATHRERLEPADYQRYGMQYQSFQRVLAVYETEPDNFPRLMELMQDMQEHGQVPAEIIKELAPGLEFNAEGAPIMPNVGGSMMPNLPGFPMGGGEDGQNCCVS